MVGFPVSTKEFFNDDYSPICPEMANKTYNNTLCSFLYEPEKESVMSSSFSIPLNPETCYEFSFFF